MRTLLAWLWKWLWRQPEAQPVAVAAGQDWTEPDNSPVLSAAEPELPAPPQLELDKPDSSPVCPVLSVEAEPATALPKAPRAPRRRIAKTLAEILDNVEECFEIAMLPLRDNLFVHRDTRRALRKLGPWVPYESPWKKDTTVDWNNWPALLYMARGYQSEDADGYEDDSNHEYAFIASAYAIKLKKAPWDVHADTRPVYEFGLSFRYHGKIEWIAAHIGVNQKEKRFTVCEELCLLNIPVKNVGSYTRKVWARPMTDQAQRWGDTKAEREQVLCELFNNIIGWWQKRDDRWSVSVRKDKLRVTFSVEYQNTKHFFKDRDKTILAKDGKAKRIIHHVDEHIRVRNGKEITVKEHIRGLRLFDWRGYACAVTAPHFHTWTLQGFNVAGEDENDQKKNKKYIDMPEIAGWLAKAEDTQEANKSWKEIKRCN